MEVEEEEEIEVKTTVKSKSIKQKQKAVSENKNILSGPEIEPPPLQNYIDQYGNYYDYS